MKESKLRKTFLWGTSAALLFLAGGGLSAEVRGETGSSGAGDVRMTSEPSEVTSFSEAASGEEGTSTAPARAETSLPAENAGSCETTGTAVTPSEETSASVSEERTEESSSPASVSETEVSSSRDTENTEPSAKEKTAVSSEPAQVASESVPSAEKTMSPVSSDGRNTGTAGSSAQAEGLVSPEAVSPDLAVATYRSRRAAGGWTVQNGQVKYIDPATGRPVKDGTHFIDGKYYLFNGNGALISGWYTDSRGKRAYAQKNGQAFFAGAFSTPDGVRYVFDKNAHLLLDGWIDEPGYGRAYGAPKTGIAYRNGAFTVADGIRYVFGPEGYLALNRWIDEPGYGRAYGAPKTGIAYRNGAYTVADGIRYVFSPDGYLALNRWIQEPGYGRAYGAPKTGIAYRNGAYTVADGIRYVFDEYGYLAYNRWVDEPGYGRAYAAPKTGRAYTNGAFTVADGIRYVFGEYGYLVKDRWIYEKNYGWAYGDPKTGAAYNNGLRVTADGERHVFSEAGYAQQGWCFDPVGGFCFGMDEKGLAAVNKRVRMNGRIYRLNSLGFWGERKNLTADEASRVEYVEKDQHLYLSLDGKVLDTAVMLSGRLVFVRPGGYEVTGPIGWSWYGDKEYYFLSNTKIAKPYQKVPGGYVNGAYGARIAADAKGIDVSFWNSAIDWSSVKKDGVDFAFVRAAYGSEGPDSRYIENLRGARAAGIKTGVYLYSMAATVAEAEREAEYVISLLKGQNLDLPVAFDIEDESILKKTKSNAERTALVRAFAERVKRAGYKVCLYSNLNWMNNYLNAGELRDYDLWLAHWHSEPGLPAKYWQASESGKVDGIGTNVDIDFAFGPWH